MTARLDLDALERAALAVGPEQWFSDETGTLWLSPADPATGPEDVTSAVIEVYLRSDNLDNQRQAFLAAANPATILELIRRLRAAEADCAAKDVCSDGLMERIATLEAAAEQAKADMLAVSAELARARLDQARYLKIRRATPPSSAGFSNSKPTGFIILPAWDVGRVGVTLDEAVDALPAEPADQIEWLRKTGLEAF